MAGWSSGGFKILESEIYFSDIHKLVRNERMCQLIVYHVYNIFLLILNPLDN